MKKKIKLGILKKDVRKIKNEFGNVEDFIIDYKKGNCDYKFSKGFWVGSREIVLAERDMTVREKKAYSLLYENIKQKTEYSVDSVYKEKQIKYFIDVDEIDNAINELTEKRKTAITKWYGLNRENHKTTREIASEFGVSNQAISDMIELGTRKLAKNCAKNGRGIIYDEDIESVNEKYEELLSEEQKIKEIEEKLISIDKQTVTDVNNIEIDDIVSSVKEQRELQNQVRAYYEKLSEKTQQKEELEARIERHKSFEKVYNTAYEEYLQNENIFNPDYIIKGTKTKNLEPVKECPREDSIYSLYLSTMDLVYLHHAGICKISELIEKAGNKEKFKKYISSIDGLDDFTAEKIYENLIEFRYIRKEEQEAPEERDPVIPSIAYETEIYKLGLSAKAYNCLQRARINNVGELLEFYDNYGEGEGWKWLENRRGCGKKTIDDILDKLEKNGFTKNGVPITEQINDETLELIESIKQRQETLRKLKLELSNQVRRDIYNSKQTQDAGSMPTGDDYR